MSGGTKFRYFVIFAAMRTGSNFLEANINRFADLESHGELFNPYFVGGAKKDTLFGLTMKARDEDPFQLLDAVLAQAGDRRPGFRFFHDHDPRILEHCLADPECGKVILTRNPLECYVSRKIAAVTGQWRLTNLKHEKTAKVHFESAEFERYLDEVQQFQLQLLAGLQASGQSAFYINYEDLHSLDVLNGLGRFLGSDHQLEALDTKVKKQNPSALESKVENYDEMRAALGRIDFLNLSRTPNLEPRRGAAVPGFVAGQNVPVLFLPIRGSVVAPLKAWLSRHEIDAGGEVLTGMNQKTLKTWRNSHPGFQVVTVVRHPVARAYHSFCEYVLSTDYGAYRDLRAAIIQNFRVKIPKKGAEAPGYDLDSHRAAFLAFLKFVKANLTRQTGVRIDPAWASQAAIIRGATQVAIPSHVLAEDRLQAGLSAVESLCGLAHVALPEVAERPYPFALSEVYNAKVEARVRDIYAQDYLNFGFADWSKP